MRAHGRSFAFATRFLPAAARPDVSTLYAFCRVVDDLVDEPSDVAPEEVRRQLEGWQRWLATSPVPPKGSELTTALAAVVNRHGIPASHLVELVEGCKADLAARAFQTFDELRHYCYQVGATVGLAMCPIVGVHDPRGLGCARDLGIAMQLTNVIRDVPEDVAMDRHYLPAEEVALFGDDLPRLIEFQCARARDYYQAGCAGIRWVQPGAQFAIRLAATLYEAILDKVAQQGYDPYAGRASTSLWEKVWLAVKLRLGG